ncbi:MAG: hypothetical protein ORN28_02205, partial [Rhodoferax sp.]|nr:hypothetical protein [Rhodoferax sp.]
SNRCGIAKKSAIHPIAGSPGSQGRRHYLPAHCRGGDATLTGAYPVIAGAVAETSALCTHRCVL